MTSLTAAAGRVSIREQACCSSTVKVAICPALQHCGDIACSSMQVHVAVCLCTFVSSTLILHKHACYTRELCISKSIPHCGHQHDSSYSQLLNPLCKSACHELICRSKICPTCLEMMMKTIKNKAQVVQQHHKVYAHALTKHSQSAKRDVRLPNVCVTQTCRTYCTLRFSSACSLVLFASSTTRVLSCEVSSPWLLKMGSKFN